MNNRFDDEFGPGGALQPLVVGTLDLTPSGASVPRELRATTTIAGATPEESTDNSIQLRFQAPLTVPETDRHGQPAQTYLIGFHYALSPRVEVGRPSIDGPFAIIGPYVTALRSRHGKSFAFILARPGIATSSLTITLPVVLAPDSASPFSGTRPDIDLSKFVMYTLLDYDVRWAGIASAVVSPGSLHEVGGQTLGHHALTATLQARLDPSKAVTFTGSAEAGPSGKLGFEFPHEDPANSCTWSVLPYIANLAYYGQPRSKVLSYAERLELDTLNPRLRTTPPAPAESTPMFRWGHRVLHLHKNTRALLGDNTARLSPVLDFCVAQGVSMVIADTASNPDVPAALGELSRRNLQCLAVRFDWDGLMKVNGVGSGADPEGLVAEGNVNLFKNPVQLDVQVLNDVASRFARGHAGLAMSRFPARGQLLVETFEIGDTAAPFPFHLPRGHEIDLASEARKKAFQDELDVRQYQLPDAWTPFSHNPEPLSRPHQFRLQPDHAYHHAYWRQLILEFDGRLGYWSATPILTQPGLDREIPALSAHVRLNLRDLSAVFSALPSSTDPMTDPSIGVTPDFDRFLDALPSNGPHDLKEYGTVAHPVRFISERQNDAMLSTSSRVHWYCGFRNWVQANLAYLVAAQAALKQSLNGTPHLSFSNLSKPIGYWGYESYHTVRSGALDIVWFNDRQYRKIGTEHLIFSGVLADFARALTRLPQPPTRPFAPAVRPLGVWFSNARADVKAMIWAGRGARYFEVFSSGDSYSTEIGWGNTGDLAYQPLAQGRSAMTVLRTTSEGFEDAERPPARVALLVPQTASIWTLTDDQPSGESTDPNERFFKGFQASALLDEELHGQHAMFTHENIAVDLIFEEAIVDDILAKVPLLSRYDVLCVNTAYLRDDVFHAVAQWVTGGGVLVVGSGTTTQDLSPVSRNEFAQDRNDFAEEGDRRDHWLHLDRTGRKGSVLNLEGAAASPGKKYIETLGLVDDYMVPTDGLTAAAAFRSGFVDRVEDALGVNQRHPLRGTRTAWATEAQTSGRLPRPVLTEVIDLRKSRTKRANTLRFPKEGIVIVINHRHRNYDHSSWSRAADTPLDPATAEPVRVPTPMVLHLRGLRGSTIGAAVYPDTELGVSQRYPVGPDGDAAILIQLGDYALVRWTLK